MAPRLSMLVLGFLGPTIAGCGTTLNLDGKERLDLTSGPVDEIKDQRAPFPFGGLANDVAWMRDAKHPMDSIGAAIDVPFSLAGDVVTLPWVTYQWLFVDWRPQDPMHDEWRRFWMNEPQKLTEYP
jgi:hypothetical protein